MARIDKLGGQGLARRGIGRPGSERRRGEREIRGLSVDPRVLSVDPDDGEASLRKLSRLNRLCEFSIVPRVDGAKKRRW